MQLTDLGFDSSVYHTTDPQYRECLPARVSRVDRDRYLVLNEHGEVSAEPTGKLLFSAESPMDLPCVGDWVLVQYHNDGELAIVHAVLPRRTQLRRRAAGNRVDVQMIATNIDTACVVQSCDENFNIRRLERSIVLAADGGIDVMVLLNKADLLDEAARAAHVDAIRAAKIDAPVLFARALQPDGLDDLRGALHSGKTYCLLGSSGVGKTTILNALLGEEHGETAPVREQDGRGRHTTTRRELAVLDSGALLIDTPGMREVGLLGAEEGIDAAFDDIAELASSCRYADCLHLVEAGCAVLAACMEGAISTERYEAYQKLRRESAFYGMSYAERRKRDRDFGRMFKKALEQLAARKPRYSE